MADPVFGDDLFDDPIQRRTAIYADKQKPSPAPEIRRPKPRRLATGPRQGKTTRTSQGRRMTLVVDEDHLDFIEMLPYGMAAHVVNLALAEYLSQRTPDLVVNDVRRRQAEILMPPDAAA